MRRTKSSTEARSGWSASRTWRRAANAGLRGAALAEGFDSRDRANMQLLGAPPGERAASMSGMLARHDERQIKRPKPLSLVPMSGHPSSSALWALGAIALWALLATFGVALSHLPPFLLTGLGLVVGSLPGWPRAREWRVPATTLVLGVYGLFGFHFLLFVALRHAPAVEANLVNYLWPLLMVVLAPVLLPGLTLRVPHVLAAFVGFAGAALAIAGGRGLSGGLSWGYLPALGSAFVWSTYSLLTRRVAPFPTAAIGLFGLVSGALSLACHAL